MAIVAVSILVACGDGPPAKPSPPVPEGQFAGIEVVGPDSLRVGESVQFVANIRLADGTIKSATRMSNLTWRSSNASVMSVNNAGMVTATSLGGEAVITADSTPSGTVQGTRRVTVLPKAAISAAVDVSQQGTSGQISYAFTVTLTESAGVAATVTGLWIYFDGWWGNECRWTSDKLGQRLPANGAVPLSVTCDNWGYEAYEVGIDVELKDDNGYTTLVGQYRSLGGR